MEDTGTFVKWLHKLLQDAEEKLDMTDQTLAYILIWEGATYLFRAMCKEKLKEEK